MFAPELEDDEADVVEIVSGVGVEAISPAGRQGPLPSRRRPLSTMTTKVLLALVNVTLSNVILVIVNSLMVFRRLYMCELLAPLPVKVADGVPPLP